MSSEQIRQKFLDFFKKKGHVVVPSSPLLSDDPSVLLTTSGMQQFKKHFTGELNPMSDFGSQRTCSIQKCFRTSDIEEVGDKTHLTFFEMLGNFSFGSVSTPSAGGPRDFGKGGYFKKAAIFWAYEFLTQVLGVETDRIHATVFKGDEKIPRDSESYKIWSEDIGLPAAKIMEAGREDNFWGPTGKEGPCGPTTEIYIDGVEVWNLVFNEYYSEKLEAGNEKLEKLKNPGVDTGMGLERIASILQGEEDVFRTDLFAPIVAKLNEILPSADERTIKILADHLRASSFLAAEGLVPSNKEAGYILRRLLRRMMAYQIKKDLHAGFLAEGVKVISKIYSPFYSELKDSGKIIKIIEDERDKFQQAVTKGLKALEGMDSVDADQAFNLYETFGLPFELIKELVPQASKDLKKEDFEKEFKKHQEISRAGAEKKFGGHGLALDTGEIKAEEKDINKVVCLHTVTHLLHQALRDVLGEQVRQMGSDINPERTRFDFAYDGKVEPHELKKIEAIVNQKIKEDLPVSMLEMDRQEAEEIGALSSRNKKYPDKVKVYFIAPEGKGIEEAYNKEFCGGPHVERTSEIGKFKILKEEGVAAGVRRIRAEINHYVK